MFNNSNNNNDDESNFSGVVRFLILHKKKILPIVGIFASLFFLLLTIILPVALVNSIGTAFAETIYEGLTNIKEGFENLVSDLGEFGENFIMLFNGDTDEKAYKDMKKAEEAYYKKLKKVAKDFMDRYDVTIDTTMITATLFYGRTEMMDNSEIDNAEVDDSTVENYGTKDWYKEQKELYKKAKDNIERLAYYQIVVTVNMNACVPESSKYSGTKPETDKEIAENWDSPFEWYDFGKKNYRYLLNIRTNYNYVDENIAKENNKVGICPYSDAEGTLTSEHDAAYNAYLEAEKEYEDAIDYIMSEYDECCRLYGSTNCSYDEHDADKEREKADAARAAWEYYLIGYGGVFDTDGGFNCMESKNFGYLDYYSDRKKYKNYTFDPSQFNPKSSNYDYKDALNYFSNTAWGQGSSNCSEKPAMSLKYNIELAREGVYYWRLLSENPDKDNQSFIKEYFFFDTDVFKEDEIEQVELIYDDYVTWSNRMLNKFGSFLCLDFDSGIASDTPAGDPTTWKQSDPRWADNELGNSTLGSVGCFVTAWSIQLALMSTVDSSAMLEATGCASIDPGSIAKYLAMNGAFGPEGDLLSLASLSALVPGLQFGSESVKASNAASTFAAMLAAGQRPIVRVKYGDAGQHWVAVTGVDASGNIQIADPGYPKTTLSEWGQTNESNRILDVRYMTVN